MSNIPFEQERRRIRVFSYLINDIPVTQEPEIKSVAITHMRNILNHAYEHYPF